MDTALKNISHLAATTSHEARQDLIVQLRKLADSLEDRIGTIHRFGHIELLKGMIEVGYDLGLFKLMATASGPLTVDEISQQTSADPRLLRRILRYYNTINVARETAVDTYEATNVTRNLTEKVTESALFHYYGLVSEQYRATAVHLKNNGYQNPSDEKHTAFQEGWKTTCHPFEWMTIHPEQSEHFHTYMSLRRQAEVSWLAVYPVIEETRGVSDPERPLYVNVGGGIGHQCAQFKKRYPDLPGRVILQDRPSTVAQALPTPGVENMAHDFFEEQPVKGAKFYFMRGVPHNHPAHRVKKLFENIKAAMAPDSVLLVDETVLPDQGVGIVAASIDLTMLGAFASMERTEKDWREICESAGLELTKTYTYNPLVNESVMDIRLPNAS